MTRLLLVRHGESTWNLTGRYQGRIDTELSDRGVEQAARAAACLSHVAFDVVYSSPLRRAFHTALSIALAKGFDVRIDDDLIEIDHGAWNGLLRDEVEKRYGPLFEMWLQTPSRVRMPGGESLGDVAERVKRVLTRLAAAHPDSNVVVCSHDAVLKAAVAIVTGMNMDNFWTIRLDNASVTTIELGDGFSRLITLNDVCHLGGLCSDVSEQAL